MNFNHKKAFSIIELVIVLVLIGLLAFFVAPKYFNIKDYSERAFFNETLFTIRYAQKLAVSIGRNVRVDIDDSEPAKIELKICNEVGKDCRKNKFNIDVKDPAFGKSYYERIAPDGVTVVKSDDFPIYFDLAGAAHKDDNGDVIAGETFVTINGKTIKIVGETGYGYEE